MNKVAARGGIVFVLVLVLLAGVTFFVVEYAMQADDWVTFPGSPHVYTGRNIGCGTVTDRDGVLLLNLGSGRTYSDSKALREAMVHWIGDRNGSVDAPALSAYAAELAGFELLNGMYAYGESGGIAQLTLSDRKSVV